MDLLVSRGGGSLRQVFRGRDDRWCAGRPGRGPIMPVAASSSETQIRLALLLGIVIAVSRPLGALVCRNMLDLTTPYPVAGLAWILGTFGAFVGFGVIFVCALSQRGYFKVADSSCKVPTRTSKQPSIDSKAVGRQCRVPPQRRFTIGCRCSLPRTFGASGWRRKAD